MNKYNWNNTFPQTPRSFHNKVVCTLNNLPQHKENGEMQKTKINKKISFKKGITIAFVAAMALATTAFAVGKISSITVQSSSKPTYTTLPTTQEISEDFGFAPKFINEFENGYTFASGSSEDIEGLDEQGNSVGKTKELSIDYAKSNNKVHLTIGDGNLSEEFKQSDVVDTYLENDLHYDYSIYKFLPVDYVMTEQDEQDKISGKYVFSVGSDKVEISEMKQLGWTQGEIKYSLLAVDSDLSQNDLVEMAHEIIDAK